MSWLTKLLAGSARPAPAPDPALTGATLRARVAAVPRYDQDAIDDRVVATLRVRD